VAEKKTQFERLIEDDKLGDDEGKEPVQESSFAYALGSEVEDKITGYKGILSGRTEWLFGCRRYIIQSREKKDGVPVKSLSVDEDSIKVLTAADPHKARFKFKLGATGKCLISGYQGLIVGRTEWLYGEAVYNVQTRGLHEGRPIESYGVNEKGLELVEESTIQKPVSERGSMDGREPARTQTVSGRSAAVAR